MTRATATLLGALTCAVPAAVSAQANPWNPYPMTQPAPMPAPAPALPTAPQAKYYQEPVAPPPIGLANPGPSRFAPADLDQRLTAGVPLPPSVLPAPPMLPGQTAPLAQPYSTYGTGPYGYPQVQPAPGYGAWNSTPGYPPGYPSGGTGQGVYSPPGYPSGNGGYAPPYGGFGGGGFPGSGFSPFGFW